MTEPDETHLATWAEMQAINAAKRMAKPTALSSGGGGGTSGGMEPRIAKLEAHMEHVLDELKKLAPVPERLARIEERVSHLPTKDELGSKLRNWVGGAVAFLSLVTVAAKFLHLG